VIFDRLTNHTPHQVCIYAQDAPDTVTTWVAVPIRVIPRQPEPARLAEFSFTAEAPAGGDYDAPVPIYHVTYMQQQITGLPAVEAGVGRIVSMPVALACPHREDLLVPFREVRNSTGTVIGCRALARPTSTSYATAA
jgi:hypothetical protein